MAAADDVMVVVLTGGPMGGKSTVKDRLQSLFGDKIYTKIPEAATALFASGLTAPAGDQSEALNELLQEMIWRYQSYMENSLIPEARRQGAKVVLLDRGVLDGAAYITGGRDELLSRMGRSLDQIMDQVDIVIHLESVVMSRPELFGPTGNIHRRETFDEAIVLEHRTRDAWHGHPKWQFIASDGGVESVVNQVVNIIQPLLFQEIERKWLLKHRPVAIESVEPQQIEQIYIRVEDGFEIRYRHIDGEYFETTKVGKGLSRIELNDDRIEAVYKAAVPHALGRIAKQRYNVADGDYKVVSVDVYSGALDGLIVAEREFFTEDQARGYYLPDWLMAAVEAEVTEDPGYKNASLALNGLP